MTAISECGMETIDLSSTAAEAWPFYADDEIASVTKVLRSGRVNQWTGEKVAAFERAYEEHLGRGRAIAVANGSVALELILRAFGIGPGDEVIVTPRSFVASASCVRLVGAMPVFAEVDRNSGNITAATIADKITPRTRAVIPVHLAGWPADMNGILAIAQDAGIKVIEDCAQAHGATIAGRPVGSFGDAASFSFCQDKIITTGGEGGLVLFQKDAPFEWAWSYKDHGKSLGKLGTTPIKPGFRWLHDRIGTNWRMMEISAAIGLIQLEKLKAWQHERARNALIWADALQGIAGIRAPMPPNGVQGAYYKFYAYLDRDPIEAEPLRDQIIAAAARRGIKIFSGSCSEIYREEAFSDLAEQRLPIASELGATSLMFEVHPTLDPALLARRASVVASIVREALHPGQSKARCEHVPAA